MKQFKNLSQAELQNTKGGGILSSIMIVPVPVILPAKIAKWGASLFK